ncbi:MAG: peptidylprolyl isomerase, partial [Methylobacter sp.]
GDLGWFVSTQMVAPFSEALVKLENGKYTKVPVQTQFGWHVILKEDSRTQTPPPFEAVKEQLMPYLQRQKVQNMLESMRKQAKVEILVPLTEEKPKSETPAPAVTEPTTPAAAEQPATTEERGEKAAPAEAVKETKPATPAEPKK